MDLPGGDDHDRFGKTVKLDRWRRGWRHPTRLSWAGMRGVVTLIAAMALPPNFPERERLIFIAFVVVAATLLLQGLTLPVLVRRLNVTASGDDQDDLEQDLMRRAQEAGQRRLDELRDDGSPRL